MGGRGASMKLGKGLGGGAGGGGTPGGTGGASSGVTGGPNGTGAGLTAAVGAGSAGGGSMPGSPGAGAGAAGIPGTGTAAAGTPKTLQHYDQHAQDWYNQHFAGKYTPQEEAYMRDQIHQVFEQNAPYMTINGDFVRNCIDEHFKTQMEVGSSGGALFVGFGKQNDRVVTAEHMFGCDVDRDHMKPVDFEKYGTLMSNDPHIALTRYPEWYGRGNPILIKFKKETVYENLTWTDDDSLCEGFRGNQIGGRVKDSSFLGVHIQHVDSQLVSRFRANERYVNDADLWVNRAFGGEYLEIQYHGMLTASDIAEVYIPSGSHLTSDVIRDLKGLGVIVYQQDSVGGLNAI